MKVAVSLSTPEHHLHPQIRVCAQLLSHVQLFATPWTVAHHGDSPGKNTGVGYHALLQELFPNPGTEPRSPTFQADSLLSEPPGKPKNTGVGSLSFLQGIFLTQGLNQGLLHCRQILNHWTTRKVLQPFIMVDVNTVLCFVRFAFDGEQNSLKYSIGKSPSKQFL